MSTRELKIEDSEILDNFYGELDAIVSDFVYLNHHPGDDENALELAEQAGILCEQVLKCKTIDAIHKKQICSACIQVSDFCDASLSKAYVSSLLIPGVNLKNLKEAA